MAKLSFISDADLTDAVNNVLDAASSALQNKKFNKNVIDPFSMLFEIGGFSLNKDTWLTNEKTRQAQKSLQNSIGMFHQNIIGSAKGWESFPTGGLVDAVNKKKKMVAEIKNKHNTTKGDNKKDIYETLESAVQLKTSVYKGYVAYYVEIIPKTSARYDVPFTPSDNKKGQKKTTNQSIRRIDGYSFYHLATGIPDALEQLFTALPVVINECLKKKNISKADLEFAKTFFEAAYTPKAKKK